MNIFPKTISKDIKTRIHEFASDRIGVHPTAQLWKDNVFKGRLNPFGDGYVWHTPHTGRMHTYGRGIGTPRRSYLWMGNGNANSVVEYPEQRWQSVPDWALDECV